MPKSILNIVNDSYSDATAVFSIDELTREKNSFVYDVEDFVFTDSVYSSAHRITYLYAEGGNIIHCVNDQGELLEALELDVNINELKAMNSLGVVLIATEEGLAYFEADGTIISIEDIEEGITHLVVDDTRLICIAKSESDKLYEIKELTTVLVSSTPIPFSSGTTKAYLHGASGRVYWYSEPYPLNVYSYFACGALITNGVEYADGSGLLVMDGDFPYYPDKFLELTEEGKIFIPYSVADVYVQTQEGHNAVIIESDQGFSGINDFPAINKFDQPTGLFYNPGNKSITQFMPFQTDGQFVSIPTSFPFTKTSVKIDEALIADKNAYGYYYQLERFFTHQNLSTYAIYVIAYEGLGIIEFKENSIRIIEGTEDAVSVSTSGNNLIWLDSEGLLHVDEMDSLVTINLKDRNITDPAQLIYHGRTVSAIVKSITLNAEVEAQLSNAVEIKQVGLLDSKELTLYPEDYKSGRKAAIKFDDSLQLRLDTSLKMRFVIKPKSTLNIEFEYEPGI